MRGWERIFSSESAGCRFSESGPHDKAENQELRRRRQAHEQCRQHVTQGEEPWPDGQPPSALAQSLTSHTPLGNDAPSLLASVSSAANTWVIMILHPSWKGVKLFNVSL